MAIHGVLAGNVGKRPRLGYLASLREVHCSRSRLDDLEGDLIVEAERLMGEESRVIYSFDVRWAMSRSCAAGPQWSWKRAGRGRDTGARHRRQRQHRGCGMQAPRGRRQAYLRPREQPPRAGGEACRRDHRKRGSAQAVSFDIADRDATGTALQKLLVDGPIQIVVNNAGVHDDAVMPGMRPEQWSRVIDVSLNGFFNVTQPLLMPMIGTRWEG